MRYYPALLDLKNKKCIVVGGGNVAGRKVNALLKAGACVGVISPILSRYLASLRKNKRIFCIKSEYQKKFLKGAFLTVVATDNRIINSKVARDASQQGILVNVVDSPRLSNFIVPAVLEHKDLIISISTSAKAPCLSKKIKEDLSRIIIPRYAKLLNSLPDFRKALKLECPDANERKSILSKIVNSKANALPKKGFKPALLL